MRLVQNGINPITSAGADADCLPLRRTANRPGLRCAGQRAYRLELSIGPRRNKPLIIPPSSPPALHQEPSSPAEVWFGSLYNQSEDHCTVLWDNSSRISSLSSDVLPDNIDREKSCFSITLLGPLGFISQSPRNVSPTSKALLLKKVLPLPAALPEDAFISASNENIVKRCDDSDCLLVTTPSLFRAIDLHVSRVGISRVETLNSITQ